MFPEEATLKAEATPEPDASDAAGPFKLPLARARKGGKNQQSVGYVIFSLSLSLFALLYLLELHSKHSQRVAQRHRHSDDVAQLRDRSKAKYDFNSGLWCRPRWGRRGVGGWRGQTSATDRRLKVFQADGFVAVAAVVVDGALPGDRSISDKQQR